MASALVIGGGFLGATVAARLRERGDGVVVFSRSFLPELERAGQPGIVTVEGQIVTVEGQIAADARLLDLIDAADVVYYFAGHSTPASAEAEPTGTVELSVLPATLVLELMRAGGTRRIVLASSGGTVYGEPSTYPTPEDHPARPVSLHGHNALTIERYARFFGERYGLEPVILRIATAYGPGQRIRGGQGVVAAWMQAAMNGEPAHAYGSLETRRDFVYSKDVADAAIGAAENASPGTYNVGAGHTHTLEELVREIEAVTGRELELIQQPARGVDVSHTELDCSRLAAEIGWSAATSLHDGLRATREAAVGLVGGR